MLVVGGPAVHLAGQLGEAVGGLRGRAVGQVLLGRGEDLGPLEDHRRRHVHQAVHLVVQCRPDDRVVERVVDLGEGVGQLVEVGDPAHDRGQVDHLRAACHRLSRLIEVAQVARVDLAALAHPLGRGPLVGHAHLEPGVSQQTAHDRRSDGAGAAGDEHPAHAGAG